jgi:DNA-binding NarL/FixJ family response regulator
MADASGDFFLLYSGHERRKSNSEVLGMRIMVADHLSKVRFALRTLLSRQPGVEVVGEAATAKELLAQVSASQPDLVLLHWRLYESAPDLLLSLQRVCPGLRVIVLSARSEAGQEALVAGAEAFVCKMDPPDKLLAAIGVGTCQPVAS